MDLDATRKQKHINVRVATMDADLEFKLEEKALGRDLFDLVCRTLGLRELWYFGLQYQNTKGYHLWLQMNKKVAKQNVSESDGALYFVFLVKFFPEVVEDELIQDITRHLFYLQVKQSIMKMDVYCPPEASVLLATYAVQAELGDFDGEAYKPSMLQLDQLLPQRVLSQYEMTPEMWEDRIRVWWVNNRGMSREDAELEYLKIAQDLDMYGVHYFLIHNKKGTELWLGVSPLSVNIYEHDNKLVVKTRFKWSEISKIYFKNKQFTVECIDAAAQKTHFWSTTMCMNQIILDLCIGSHNLFLKRRQPDSLEIQQMKLQAKQERTRRQASLILLEKERAVRADVEREKDRLAVEVQRLSEQLRYAEEAIKRTSEMNDLLAEKARISEEEALVLSKRASEAEAEIQRIKLSAIETEEAKIVFERKAREAELIAKRMVEESDKRSVSTQEADRLRNELQRARHAEQSAKERMYDVAAGAGSSSAGNLAQQQYPSVSQSQMQQQQQQPPLPNPYTQNVGAPAYVTSAADNQLLHHPYYASYSDQNGNNRRSPIQQLYGGAYGGGGGVMMTSSQMGAPPPDPMSRSMPPDGNIQSLTAEIEKERVEYLQKSRNLQEQLSELRCEIEGLKMADKQTGEDRIYNDNLQQGENKYSTLKKSGAGSAKTRIQLFDGL